jgi:hypothetical protein
MNLTQQLFCACLTQGLELRGRQIIGAQGERRPGGFRAPIQAGLGLVLDAG